MNNGIIKYFRTVTTIFRNEIEMHNNVFKYFVVVYITREIKH